MERRAARYGNVDCAGLIQAVIFEVNDRDLIGYPTPTGYRYCCTKELVPKTKCFQDRLIYQVCSTLYACQLHMIASACKLWKPLDMAY